MAQVSIKVNMDANLKKEFDVVCEKIGIPASDLIDIFVRTVVRKQRVPFELEPNEETLAAMKEAEDIGKHPEQYKSYQNVDELLRELSK